MAGTVCVVGSINADLVVRVPRLPAPGETLLGYGLVTVPGGKGANQAVAASRAGARTRFVGATGDDGFAADLRGSLEAERVDIEHLAIRPGPSGIALITVQDGGENTIVVVPGANAAVDATAVAAAVAGGALRGASVVLVQLEIPLDGVRRALQGGRAEGATTMLNAAPAQLVDSALLDLSDVLVVNESELFALSGSTDPRRAAAAFGGRPPVVVVTLGARGALVVDERGTERVAGHPVAAVDTVGAGDAFCGVFAAALAGGDERGVALVRANAAAALTVTRPGARSAPTLAELDAFLRGRTDG